MKSIMPALKGGRVWLSDRLCQRRRGASRMCHPLKNVKANKLFFKFFSRTFKWLLLTKGSLHFMRKSRVWLQSWDAEKLKKRKHIKVWSVARTLFIHPSPICLPGCHISCFCFSHLFSMRSLAADHRLHSLSCSEMLCFSSPPPPTPVSAQSLQKHLNTPTGLCGNDGDNRRR